jgi:hypothetical protein
MTRTLTLIALSVLAIGLSTTAHASFGVYIDCHGGSGFPNWASTSNTVTTYVKVNGNLTWFDSRTVPASMCDHENGFSFTSSRWSGYDVSGIQVQISGNDAFFIDKIMLVDGATWHIWQWGVDNTLGFCLSTAPSDGNNPYCLNRVAQTWWDFDTSDASE